MTTASLKQDECFSVLWKIKNFSYFGKKLESPAFYFRRNWCKIKITNKQQVDPMIELDCVMVGWPRLTPIPMQISILTCDNSQEELIESNDFSAQIPKNVIFGNRRNSFLPEDTLSLRCRFFTPKKRGKIFICSQIGVKRKYFWWTLCNFSNYEHMEIHFCKHYVKIPDVHSRNGHSYLELMLKPTITMDSSHNFTIVISKKGRGMFQCDLKISVMDMDGNALNCLDKEFVYGPDLPCMTFPLNLKKKELDASKTMLLPNDTLSFRCCFAISEGKVIEETSYVSICEDFNTSKNLCEDVSSVAKESEEFLRVFERKSGSDYSTELQSSLKNILDDGTYSDVNLQIGTEIIKAHKSILSSRSPVFKAMFSKEIQETIRNTVVIEDLSVDTVRKFLQYVYTDAVHDCPWENLKELYLAADKYEVLSLKTNCASIMETKLSVSNVCEALVFAELHQDSRLKKSVLDFISKYGPVIFESEAWKEIEKNNFHLAFITRNFVQKAH